MGYISNISDTCSCGATFNANGEHADLTHKKWLEAHTDCRQTPTPTKIKARRGTIK